MGDLSFLNDVASDLTASILVEAGQLIGRWTWEKLRPGHDALSQELKAAVWGAADQLSGEIGYDVIREFFSAPEVISHVRSRLFTADPLAGIQNLEVRLSDRLGRDWMVLRSLDDLGLELGDVVRRFHELVHSIALERAGLPFLVLRSEIQRLMENHTSVRDIPPVDTAKPIQEASDGGHLVLTSGLLGVPGVPYGGIERFLNEYLGAPESPVFLGGRTDQLRMLDRWLVDPTPYALIVAEAGRGKSMLVSHWASTVAARNSADVVFLPISIRFGTASRKAAFTTLGARLRYLLCPQNESLSSAESWLAEANVLLRRGRQDGERPLVVILDGVDEALDWSLADDLPLPARLGNGIKILITTRPVSNDPTAEGLRRRLGLVSVTPISLPPLTEGDVGELLDAYLQSQDDSPNRDVVVRELLRVSGGDPLVLRFLLDDVRNLGSTSDIVTYFARLHPGLQGYFDSWWEDQQKLWTGQGMACERLTFRLLCVLACAMGPLMVEDVLSVIGDVDITAVELESAFRRLSRFVVGDGRRFGYVFTHPRLNQYFFEDRLSATDRAEWESRFVRWGERVLSALEGGHLAPTDVPRYLVQCLGIHLGRGSSSSDLLFRLMEDRWAQAGYSQEGTYNSYLADLVRVRKRAEESAAWGPAIRAALCQSSVVAMGSRIPVPLLRACLMQNLISSAVATSWVGQVDDDVKKALSAEQLFADLDYEGKERALSIVKGIGSPKAMALGLAGVCRHLPFEEQQTCIRTCLGILTTHLNDALDTRCDENEILKRLVPYSDAALLPDLVKLSSEISNPHVRLLALHSLLTHVPHEYREPVLRTALVTARSMEHNDDIAQCLAILLPFLEGAEQDLVLQDAIAAARTCSTSNPSRLAGLLRFMRPELRQSVVDDVLAVTQSISEAKERLAVFERLGPWICDTAALDRALLLALETTPTSFMSRCMIALVQHQCDDWVTRWWAWARGISDTHRRFIATNDLSFFTASSELKKALLKEACELAPLIEDPGERAASFTYLYMSPLLEDERGRLLSLAFDTLKSVTNEATLSVLIEELFPALDAQAVDEALDILGQMRWTPARENALGAIALHLNRLQLEKALHTSRLIHDEREQLGLAVMLLDHIPEGPQRYRLISLALAVASKTLVAGGSIYREVTLVRHLGEPEREDYLARLKAAVTDSRPLSMAWNISLVLPLLAEPDQSQFYKRMEEHCLSITEPKERADALARLIKLAPPDTKSLLVTEGLNTIRSINNPLDRSYRLLTWHNSIPQVHLTDELRNIWAQAAPLAASDKAAILRVLAHFLPQDMVRGILIQVLRGEDTEDERRQIVLALSTRLPDDLAPEATPYLQRNVIESDDLEELTRQLPYLEGREMATGVADVLQMCINVHDAHQRAKLLARVMKHVPENERLAVLFLALDSACKVDDTSRRAGLLADLSRELARLNDNPVVHHRALMAVLDRSSLRRRAALLEDLAAFLPLVLNRNRDLASEVTASFISVSEAWP